jgi:4-amino-4-deoxy-L-arabinose transferase-like glycosyltransferase
MVIATVGSHGEYSVWGALQEHVVSRGIHGMHHKQPFWYYAKVLPWALFPWSALAVGAAVFAWRNRQRDIDRFLLVAATVVVIFFSVSTEKRDLYVLSAVPAVALLIGRLLTIDLGWADDRVENDERPTVDWRWISIAQGIVGVILVAVGVAIPFAAQRLEEIAVHVAVPLSIVLAVTGTIVLVMAILRRGSQSAIPLAAGMALAFVLATSMVYPALEGRKSARAFALQLKELTATSRAQGHEVVAFDLGNLPVAIAFYSDGVYTVETDDPAVLERHLMQAGEVFATINATGLEMLSDEALQRVVVLHQTRLSRRDVLLVSNHGG